MDKLLSTATLGLTNLIIGSPETTKTEDRCEEKSLGDLEKSMDPLIARQYHNRTYSPLLRLPPELIFSIMEYLAEDEAHFFILRLVCRRFRLLLAAQKFGQHRFTLYHYPCTVAGCNGVDPNCTASPKLGFHRGHQGTVAENLRLSDRIASLLWRDELCAACFRNAVRQLELQTYGYPRSLCKFKHDSESTESYRYCYGCRLHHPPTLFPPWWSSLGNYPAPDPCIGRSGHVRLCEHQVVTWDMVERCLTNAKMLFRQSQENGSGTPMRVQCFIQRCLHWSHLWRCGQLCQVPTAVLSYRGGDYDIRLTWIGHSGNDAFPSFGSHTGRYILDVAEVRQMFQCHRRGPAQYIMPRNGLELQEMASFARDHCPCLRYDGELALRNTSSEHTHVSIEQDTPGLCHKSAPGKTARWSTMKHSNVMVYVMFCSYPADVRSPRRPCIATEYIKDISGTSMPDELGAPPSHAWLHAMDRDSFQSHRGLGVRETCNDSACSNSHQQLRCDAELDHVLNNRNVTLSKDQGKCFYTQGTT